MKAHLYAHFKAFNSVVANTSYTYIRMYVISAYVSKRKHLNAHANGKAQKIIKRTAKNCGQCEL